MTGTEASEDNQNGSNKEDLESPLNFAIHFRYFAFKINLIRAMEIWTTPLFIKLLCRL